MVAQLRFLHLYPQHLNLYGDRGNLIALERRAVWYGLPEPERVEAGPGAELDWSSFDLLFIGGGQDQQQRWILPDLERKAEGLAHALEEGLPFLAVCGGYQLLGEYYRPLDGGTMKGLGVLPCYTEARPGRLIGNVVAESEITGRTETLVGFENHSGRTYLRDGARPLAKVRIGSGNNGEDGSEGIHLPNGVGTYLHGSLLPKNPWLADWLLDLALRRRGHPGLAGREPLDDEIERRAHAAAVRRAEAARR